MLALALAAISGGTPSIAPAVAQPLPRAISINTCTDQLLLALAEPGQILGLSRFSRHAEMSYRAAAAARYPLLRGAAEEVLKRQPDFVMAGAFSGRATRDVLRSQGVRVETFAPPTSIEGARQEIARAGSLLGQQVRAKALIDAIDAEVSRAKLASAGRKPITVLAIQRRAFVSGRVTLISDVLETAGFANIATRLGVESIGQVSIETIIKERPDALVLEGLEAAPDQSTAVLQHPVLKAAFPPSRRIVVPVAEVTCGGEGLVALIARIGREGIRLREGG